MTPSIVKQDQARSLKHVGKRINGLRFEGNLGDENDSNNRVDSENDNNYWVVGNIEDDFEDANEFEEEGEGEGEEQEEKFLRSPGTRTISTGSSSSVRSGSDAEELKLTGIKRMESTDNGAFSFQL